MAALYALMALALVAFEVRRPKRALFDQLSVAIAFFLANVVVPAALMHLLLDGGFVGPEALAKASILSHFHDRVTTAERLAVLAGSLGACVSLVLGYLAVAPRSTSRVAFSTGPAVEGAWILLGILFTGMMVRFGDSLSPGHPIQGLLLSTYFRAEDLSYGFERTAASANIYAFTHSFLLVAVLGVALAARNGRRRWLYGVLTVAFLLVAVVASGARRTALIAAMLVYLYQGARSGKYRVGYLVGLLLLSVPLLYFGKEVLRGLGTLEQGVSVRGEGGFLEQLLVAASEFGVSHVESLGTLTLYHGGPRWGVDHVLSLLRFLPEGMVGLDIHWPERIVRISTAYLIGDASMQDIPPGYIGQCWIDLPVLGFAILPGLHGMTFGLVESVFRKVDLKASPVYLMAYLVLGYVVALPFNSGTLDYVFSIDVALVVFLLLVLHWANAGHWPGRAPSPGEEKAGTAT